MWADKRACQQLRRAELREASAGSPELEHLLPSSTRCVTPDLSSHPLCQTPDEADYVPARLRDEAQGVAIAEVCERPMRFEEDEEFEHACGRVSREEKGAAIVHGGGDEVCNPRVSLGLGLGAARLSRDVPSSFRSLSTLLTLTIKLLSAPTTTTPILRMASSILAPLSNAAPSR